MEVSQKLRALAALRTHGTQTTPSQSEVERLLQSGKGNCVPVYATLPADIITPVMAYLRLTEGATAGHAGGSFLLESILEGAHQARYSFVGASQCLRG
jgi:anthranilate synthase component 1